MADTLANTNGRVREWIGPRIVPVFADEVQWDEDSTYEPLMMVQNAGETFMSRQYVPAGAPLPDVSNGQESTDYWVHMSNWNAQVEAYREEVMEYARTVLTFSDSIDALNAALPIADFDSTNTVDARFDTDEGRLTAIEADNWVTAIRISADAVTTAKIEDGAVTSSKIADSSITSSKIVDGTIGTSDIANGAITDQKLAGRTWGFIGDSFSDDNYYSWVPGLAALLGQTVVNKAKSGAGFTSASNSFLTQLTSLNEDSNTYSDIIIYGGCNDENSSSSAITTAVTNFCTYLKNNFAIKPRVHLFIGNMPFSNPEDIRKVVQTVNKTFVANYGNTYVYPNINGWQIANFGFVSNTNVHPSNSFLSELPHLFYQALKTGNTSISKMYWPTSQPNTNVTVNTAGCMVCTNTFISTASMGITVSGTVVNPIVKFEVPESIQNIWKTNYLIMQGIAQNNMAFVYDIHDKMSLKLYQAQNASYTLQPLVMGICNG